MARPSIGFPLTLGIVLLIVVLALAASFPFQLLSIAVTWLVARAFGIDVSFGLCSALVPLVWFFTMIPVSLGGVGLREVAFVYLFGSMGAPDEAGLLLSLGTYFALVMVGLVGGLWFTFDRDLVRAVKAGAPSEPD